MKTLALTGFNEKFRPLAEITVPSMRRYADRHGYAFYDSHYGDSQNPYWAKISPVIDFLRDYDRVIWLDADQLITNPEVSFDHLSSGVHFSQDWGEDALDFRSFSACGFVACRDSLPIFEWVESERATFIDGPFPEQTPLRMAYAQNMFPNLMRVHARRVFNAVPREVHPTVVEPWQPGDFAAHITMIPVEERVKLAKEISAR